ncbi:hypothetical protein ZEAMMB73_Zm00001d032404 [Zea mays]|uniref:Uncharacterized protein n=1 Tax=Zea mays TaxID=4577 RepID=A0A1D6KQH2_MAIZE|nr:hypothetical protein ZEAMMB73_Zm00001d032404 [Zea mays]ONM05013.1 hypothetical protein ZEAMMB73_Zm00001d032404 [Zea mays]
MAAMELAEHSDACDHVVLLPEKKETAGPARREMGYKATPRRNVLWALNNAEANGGTTSVPRMEAAPMIKFSGRQDVERLLK